MTLGELNTIIASAVEVYGSEARFTVSSENESCPVVEIDLHPSSDSDMSNCPVTIDFINVEVEEEEY